MKRKLLLLNALLAGVFILGATELYRQILEGDARYDRLQAFADPKQPPEFPSPADPTPTRASDFMPIVNRLLFSEDRNADIFVEIAEAEVAQRPPWPQLAGLVDFGDGPFALMTASADEPPSWIAVGGKIGDFVFQGIEGDEVKLSWNEEQFTVTKDQLNEAPAPPRRETVTARPQRERPTRQSAAAAPGDLAGVGQDSRIGPDMGSGHYRVMPGDNSPEGTEHDGFIKRGRKTPFGSTAWWEKKEQ